MKSYIILSGVVFCISVCLSSNTVYARSAMKGSSSAEIDQFGKSASEPIHKGFVFIDGQYIEEPYVVERKGLAIYVNDSMIVPPAYYSNKSVLTGDVDPSMPENINKNTSLYDTNVTHYLLSKSAYIRKHNKGREKETTMAEVYRSLPCVKDVKFDEKVSDVLHVITYSGEHHPIGLNPPSRPADVDPSSVLQRVESKRRSFERRLRKGDCYFFSSNKGRVSFSESKAIEILPAIVSRSRLDTAAHSGVKQQRLADRYGICISNLVVSPQLEERIFDLQSKSKE